MSSRIFSDFCDFFTGGFKLYFHPDVTPDPNKDVLVDPHYGFSEPRKVKVMVATKAEMQSCKLPLEDRDYCAHLLIDYKKCVSDKFPFVFLCNHKEHVYFTCQYEDWLDRAKEYERERRLMVRKKRKAEQNEKLLLL